MSSGYPWASIVSQWEEVFEQEEVTNLLDEQLIVLLDPSSSTEQMVAARSALRTIQRLEAIPALAIAAQQRTPPRVRSGQSWRARLLSIIRRRVNGLAWS